MRPEASIGTKHPITPTKRGPSGSVSIPRLLKGNFIRMAKIKSSLHYEIMNRNAWKRDEYVPAIVLAVLGISAIIFGLVNLKGYAVVLSFVFGCSLIAFGQIGIFSRSYRVIRGGGTPADCYHLQRTRMESSWVSFFCEPVLCDSEEVYYGFRKSHFCFSLQPGEIATPGQAEVRIQGYFVAHYFCLRPFREGKRPSWQALSLFLHGDLDSALSILEKISIDMIEELKKNI